MPERRWSGWQAYCQSKLAQIMMTFDLAEALAGSGVTVNALHPATLMPTKMVLGRFGVQSTLEDGVRNTVRLVADPTLSKVSGQYFDGDREARAHPQAYDRPARTRSGPQPKAVWAAINSTVAVIREQPGSIAHDPVARSPRIA